MPFLAGLIAMAAHPTAFADYTVGALTFPYQPQPQYVAVDLGPGYVVDMNDNGDVLVNDYVYGVTDTYTYWSGGVATPVPTSDDDGNDYYWQFVANDGEVLGLFYGADDSFGVARWNIADGLSFITEDEDPGFLVPGDAHGWYWPEDWNYTRDGSIYFGVEYSVQEVLATDFWDDPVGPYNDYYRKFHWSPDGEGLAQVGDTIFEGGDAGFYGGAAHNETPMANITYPIATAPGDNALIQIFSNITYTDLYDTELDYVTDEYYDEDEEEWVDDYDAVYYYNAVVDTGAGLPEPYLQLNTSEVPGSVFFADDDTVNMTHLLAGLNFPAMLNNGIYDTFDGTLDYLDSDTFSPANLTANVDSETPLRFLQINSLGLALDNNDMPWLNGVELQWGDVLPYGMVNDDGTPKWSALLPAANLSANIYYELTNLRENSLSVAGWVTDFDTGNVESYVLAGGSGGGFALAVDNNRDGNISFDGDDRTTEDNPFTFWLNDDVDRWNTVDKTSDTPDGYDIQDDLNPADYTGNLDYEQDQIPGNDDEPGTRDLEDFATLAIDTSGVQQIYAGNSSIYVGFKWVPFSGETFTGTNIPAIKLYWADNATDGDGELDEYLTNSTVAASEWSSANSFVNDDSSTGAIKDVGNVATTANVATASDATNGTLVGVTTNADYDFVLPSSVFANVTSDAPVVYLHFEGCQRGEGYLSLVLLYYNGTGYTKLGSGAGVALQLRDVKELYERWTVGDGEAPGWWSFTGAGGGGLPAASASISTDRLPAGVSGANFTDDSPDGTPYILFVHGWNMHPWEKDAFAETAFKRLYWQGYQGRFGAFQWPTTYHDADISAIQDYDLGEYTAWLSAKPLEDLLSGTLASRYGSGNISILAHSMGNVVTGEAIRLAVSDSTGQLANTYVATQAAVPVHNYDPSVSTPGNFYDTRTATNMTIIGTYYISINVTPSLGSPNIYPGWFGPNTGSGTGIVDFYNTNDFALNNAHWELDELLKPDATTYPQGYGTTGQAPYNYSSSNYTIVANDFYNTVVTLHTPDPPTYSDHFLTLASAGNLSYNATLNDHYEILGFAAQPQSRALGAVPPAANITGNLAMPTGVWGNSDTFGGNFTEHPWHSAEFRFDNMTQHTYWGTLMTDFGFSPLFP